MSFENAGVWRLEKGRTFYYIFVGLFVASLMWSWGYFKISRGEAYKYSVQYINSDAKIQSEIGQIKSARVGYSRFRESYAGGVWTSSFDVVVEGEKRNATIALSLKNSGNGWEIEEKSVEYK